MMVEENTVMSTEEGQNGGISNDPLENLSSDLDGKRDGSLTYTDKDNEVHYGITDHGDAHEQLAHMVFELNFQNEYLKAQFEGLKTHYLDSREPYKHSNETQKEVGESEIVKELQGKVESLTRELQEQKEMQTAAAAALKHLRAACSEADAKAQDLSAKLIEAQQKKDQEIKERDDKYVELDSKFGRLLKRAKQRIQELQKEKDDLEVRFRDVNEVSEKASSQQSSLQQELERTRQNANEALRSMDVERQQLRTAANKLRDSLDEMRHSLEAKDKALEGLQQSLFEKEHMLEDMQRLLEAANEKREASIAELSAKHQKHLQSLEAQLADAVSDRSKATDTISSLQAVIAEKESEIAELDAASTGEAVRLRAAIEAAKGELNHLKQEHEKERESWDISYQAIKTKLEMMESACLRSEIEAAKIRSQLEVELSAQNQLLNSRDTELAAAKEEVSC